MGVPHFSWIVTLFLHLKASNVASLRSLFSSHISLLPSIAGSFSTFKNSCDYIALTWIVQNKLPTSRSSHLNELTADYFRCKLRPSAKFFSLSEITYHRFCLLSAYHNMCTFTKLVVISLGPIGILITFIFTTEFF